ncbi:MAG: arginase, partial [Rhizobiales bacterium]|nr:arginase [Hyphomicrobiales bacterium]
MRVGLIDLDQTVTRQLPLAALVDAGQAVCIDATDLAPKLRLVANKAVWQELQERIDTALDQHSGRGAEVFFYGSGDFHHLTAGLIARHQTPV